MVTIQLQIRHHKKGERMHIALFAAKEQRINMNGSKTARFASFASKLTLSCVFAWKPSNYIKHTITSEKECFSGYFERKSTEFTRTAPNEPGLLRLQVNSRIRVFSRGNHPITSNT